MKKLILVRHGMTDYLVKGLYQGHSDPPLNKEGRAQIKSLADGFADKEPQIIFSSPLKRARKSADILNKDLDLEIIEDDRIKEISFGEWEGETYDEIVKKYPEAFEWWKKDLANFRPEGGESLAELQKRVREFFMEIKERHEDVIAVIAHGGVIRAFMVELMGVPFDSFWKFELSPASMTVIDAEKDLKVRV